MLRSAFITTSVLLASVPVWCGYVLSSNHERVLEAWLGGHAGYRVATDVDCRCDENLEHTRVTSAGVWRAIPDYHPYTLTGDFNGDGVLDFAVVVIDRSKTTSNFTLLIFNGPFAGNPVAPPAFMKGDLDLRGQGLAYGPPRPKPYRLVLGPFESEGWIFRPSGRTYKME
jgi:hypothetical protein